MVSFTQTGFFVYHFFTSLLPVLSYIFHGGVDVIKIKSGNVYLLQESHEQPKYQDEMRRIAQIFRIMRILRWCKKSAVTRVLLQNRIWLAQQMCHIIIFFSLCSTAKDKSNQNVLFFHALNNNGWRKAYKIKFHFRVYAFQDSPRYVAAPLQAIRFANFQSARREWWIFITKGFDFF